MTDTTMLDDGRDRGETPVGTDATTLLPPGDDAGFARRWEALEATFVDSPRRTVEEADALVAEVMQRIDEGFALERARLEEHWDRGDEVSTEELRVALQRYREFFRRLLTV